MTGNDYNIALVVFFIPYVSLNTQSYWGITEC